MNRYLNFIEKHSKAVLLIVLAITILFAIATVGIKVNTSFTAFMPWGEYTDYYQAGVSGQVPELGTEKAKKESQAFVDYDYSKVEFVEADSRIHVQDVPYQDVVDVRTLPTLEPQEGDDYSRSTNYMVLVEADDLFTAKKLNLVDYVIEKMNNTRELSNMSSVLDFITLENKNGRLAIEPMNPKSGQYWTEEEAAELGRRINDDPVIKSYVVGKSGNSLLFQFSISNVSSSRLDEINSMLDILKENGIEVYLSGGAVINDKIMEYLMSDLVTLVSLSLVVILVVYFLSFRSKLSVFVPLSVSIIGLIWTFGTMALMEIPLSILNVVTPCMVLTLGSSYSMHMLNEYYIKHRKGCGCSAVTSTKGIYRTIIYACLTTVFGFLCLCISQTDGLKEFGVSVSCGILYCAVLALFYLPALLNLLPYPKTKQISSFDNGLMPRFIRRISSFILKYWMYIIILLLLVIIGFFYAYDKIGINSNYMSYFPADDPFGKESKHFAAEMGGGTPYDISLTAPEGSERFFFNVDNLKSVRAYEEKLLENPDTIQIVSFPAYVAYANKVMNGEFKIPSSAGIVNMLSRMVIMMSSQVSQLSSIISQDGNRMTLTVQHWDAQEQDLMTSESITRTYTDIVSNLDMLPEGVEVSVSGNPLPTIKFSNRLFSDQNRSTVLSLAIVFAFVVITLRSIKSGVYVIIPVFCGIMINYIFMYLFDIPFDIITVSFSSIAIGCGVDNAIHFMIRYKNNEKITDMKERVEKTLVETARPIMLSTLSIILGMLMLSFASYTPIIYFGLLMSVTLLGCMISTIVFLPCFIMLTSKIMEKIRRK